VKTYLFEIELTHEDDGRWSAVVPTLPGCATWGYTESEAMNSLQEAAKAYLEVVAELDEAALRKATQKASVLPKKAIAVTV